MPRQQASESYRGFRTAGIRLSEEILPVLNRHRTEAIADTLPAVHAFDKAHLVSLVLDGFVSRRDGVPMLRALREMEAAGIEKSRLEAQGGLHSGEQFLIRKLGEAVGGRIHLARSSGDLGAVARRATLRGHVVGILEALRGLRRTLLSQARNHAETVMPAYTIGQQAQPTTYGHWLSMWAVVFARDFARLREVYRRNNLSPAEAGMLTGSDFPVDRHRTAEMLGFDGPIPHTMDALFSHDVLLEAVNALAVHAANLARLAEDLVLWSSNEFSMIDFPDRYCGTSSLMAQKKNPYSPPRMKGLAAEAIGMAMTAYMVETGPSGFATLERQKTERALWSVCKTTLLVLEETDALIPAIIVKRERMLELASSFWAQASDVSGMLVRERDLPWRTAHQITGILVRRAEATGTPPLQLTPAMIDEAAEEYFGRRLGVAPEAAASAVDPVASVRRRTIYGGPEPATMLRAVDEFEGELTQDAAWLGEARARVARGEALLERSIDRLLADEPAGEAATAQRPTAVR